VTFAPVLSDEVAEALDRSEPVVALETTLVSHGFSGGRGLIAALAAADRVRAAGAVPATVGIVDGVVRVGLDDAELERFAAAGTAARKAGARDIAACVVQRALGATTVGGTLAVCAAAGIRFMATGGIGGVHRGFAQSLDISGDLPRIAATQVMVVCSGAKSILDVGATSELLETLGIPVLGWNTPTLPLFYTADGGPAVSAVVSAAADWHPRMRATTSSSGRRGVAIPLRRMSPVGGSLSTVRVATKRVSERDASAAWQRIRMRRRSNRSAMCPVTSERHAAGTNCASPTHARSSGRCVMA